MCGCSGPAPIGGGAAVMYGSPVQQVPIQGGGASTPVTMPGQGLAGQANIADGSMRNQQLAELSLARLREATRNLDTPEKAAAAGYKPNPSSPDHWINDQVFAVRNGYDLSRPATLMFEGRQLTGVMLSHDPSKGSPPDLGAGAWHSHPGVANELAAHVYFTKPITEAFGKESGMI